MKKVLASILVLCMVFSLCAVSASADDVIKLKMHFVDPETAPYVQGGLKIAELVSEATDGKIQIEVLSGGSLGGERDTIELAMDNSLDIATCANSVLTNFIPEMGILDQAYLWKNADEAHAAVDGRLGELIKAKAEAIGLHVIGFEESGFRNTFSTKPIKSMEDFKGVTDAWERIPEDLREPFLAAVQEGVEYARNLLNEANADAVEKLKDLGVSFYDIDVAELQAAYQAKAAEKGFTFDADWQAAVDEAVASVA